MHGLVGGKKKRGPTERVTVIGLGRFGSSVARTLNELGYEVTAIDRDPKRIQEMADHVTLAAQGDGTDQELLQQLNVDQSDVAIVAQGENLEASLLSTLLLTKLKIPWVIGKARNSLHGELLRKVGADRADSSQDAFVHGVERCIRQALVEAILARYQAGAAHERHSDRHRCRAVSGNRVASSAARHAGVGEADGGDFSKYLGPNRRADDSRFRQRPFTDRLSLDRRRVRVDRRWDQAGNRRRHLHRGHLDAPRSDPDAGFRTPGADLSRLPGDGNHRGLSRRALSVHDAAGVYGGRPGAEQSHLPRPDAGGDECGGNRRPHHGDHPGSLGRRKGRALRSDVLWPARPIDARLRAHSAAADHSLSLSGGAYPDGIGMLVVLRISCSI
jgi:hypothetical protein